MKLNQDCIRDCLLYLQDVPFNTYTYARELEESLEYSKEDIHYSIYKCYEAGLVDAKFTKIDGCALPTFIRVHDILFPGHEFLANIESDTVWNKTKAISKQIGSKSLTALTNIAAGIITTAIQNQLSL